MTDINLCICWRKNIREISLAYDCYKIIKISWFNCIQLRVFSRQILQCFTLEARRHRVYRNQFFSTEHPSADIVIRRAVSKSSKSLVNTFIVSTKVIETRFASQMSSLRNHFLVESPRNECEELRHHLQREAIQKKWKKRKKLSLSSPKCVTNVPTVPTILRENSECVYSRLLS